MIITFAGQKGGTGKSTLATHLAGMLAAEHRRVTLVDADPQHSAQMWHELRPAHLSQLALAAVPGTAETIREACTVAAAVAPDFVILDTAGNISAGVREAVRLADFVVVPVFPSLADVRSTQMFYSQVLSPIAASRELRGSVVLNNVRRGLSMSRDAEIYLRQQITLPVMQAVIHQYTAFAYAFGGGMTVCEAEPNGRATLDMRAFFAALKEELECLGTTSSKPS